MPTHAAPPPPAPETPPPSVASLPRRQRYRLQAPVGGRTWMMVAAVMVLIGLLKGINLLLLLGYALVLTLLLNLFLAVRQRRRLTGRRRISGPLFAGAECPVEVEVRNPGCRRRRGLELEDRGLGQDLLW